MKMPPERKLKKVQNKVRFVTPKSWKRKLKKWKFPMKENWKKYKVKLSLSSLKAEKENRKKISLEKNWKKFQGKVRLVTPESWKRKLKKEWKFPLKEN